MKHNFKKLFEEHKDKHLVLQVDDHEPFYEGPCDYGLIQKNVERIFERKKRVLLNAVGAVCYNEYIGVDAEKTVRDFKAIRHVYDEFVDARRYFNDFNPSFTEEPMINDYSWAIIGEEPKILDRLTKSTIKDDTVYASLVDIYKHAGRGGLNLVPKEAGNETLRDYLLALPDGETVSLGACGSAGYFYIGPNDPKTIEKVAEYLHKKQFSRFENVRKSMLSAANNLTAEFYAIEQTGKIVMTAKLLDYICKVFEKIFTYEKYKELIENFVPLLDRKIVETYPRFMNDGTAIIVNGLEGYDSTAAFWFRHEFDRDKAMQQVIAF